MRHEPMWNGNLGETPIRDRAGQKLQSIGAGVTPCACDGEQITTAPSELLVMDTHIPNELRDSLRKV